MDLKIDPVLPRRKDFRIGVLGSGFIINDCHLVAYRKAGFNPVAIASRQHDHAVRVAGRHSIPRVCDTYEQLLDDPAIEVLDIAVPPNAQLGLIKAACQRKTVKGILAQKPLGLNYAEAVEAVRACEAAGITLAVNQNMRYDQSIRACKSSMSSNTTARPLCFISFGVAAEGFSTEPFGARLPRSTAMPPCLLNGLASGVTTSSL